MTILVVHGPNLDLLGVREPEIYGRLTLRELDRLVVAHGRGRGLRVRTYQSNHEGRLIDALHRARGRVDGIVINPAAYGHTSYALRDALSAVAIPAVEVHLSDVTSRESFRSISTIADVCVAVISGKGPASYTEAIDLLAARAGRG